MPPGPDLRSPENAAVAGRAPGPGAVVRAPTPPAFPAWEFIAGVALVVSSSSALFPLLYAPATIEADEVVWLRYLWLPVYALTVALSVWNWKALRDTVMGVGPTLILLALALASFLWSIAPDVTLRRWEALAFNTLLSLYLAARFRWPDLIRIVAAAMLFLSLGSLLICLAAPSLGVHTTVNAGAWRGLWLEKNQLGFMMVIGALASLASAVVDGGRRSLWLASAALSFVLLVLSRSGTSLLCLVTGALLLAGFVLARRRPIVAVLVIFLGGCVVVATAMVMLLDFDLFFRLMGKDPTLTGRTDIWAAALRRIADRPGLGYGYGAFWHDRMGPALYIRREAKWDVPSAHNGWLELALQLGWAGVAAAAVYFTTTAVFIVRGLFARADGFWAIMYFGAFAMLSFSESEILRQNSLEWTLFAMTSVKVLADAARHERTVRPKLAVVPAA